MARDRFRIVSVALALTLIHASLVAAPPPPGFIRGDADSSGELDISDPVTILGTLFLDGSPLPCEAAADIDGNSRINIGDSIYALNFLFLGGPQPPQPYPDCGDMDFDSGLSCDEPSPQCVFTFDEFESIRYAYDIIETIAGRGAVSSDDVNAWRPEYEGGAATDAELSKPHITLQHPDGSLLIADKEAHAIRRVDADGVITTFAGTNVRGDGDDGAGPATERALNDPNGLWITATGAVFILDTGNDKVRRVDGDGVMTTSFVVPGLRTGRGLWVSDAEDLAYVASRTILHRWTPSGGLETVAAGFSQLGNFVVDPDGAIVVTDRSAHLVYRLRPGDGSRTVIAGDGRTSSPCGEACEATEASLHEVRGIWSAPVFGGYFLATQEGSQIWYLGGDGLLRLFLDGLPDGTHAGDGESYMEPGPKISQVRSVTLDLEGNMLITENDAGFVRRISFIGVAVP